MSVLVSFASSAAMQDFVEKYSHDIGIPAESLTVPDWGDYVVVHDVSEGLVRKIREGLPGVENVYADDQLDPFSQ